MPITLLHRPDCYFPTAACSEYIFCQVEGKTLLKQLRVYEWKWPLSEVFIFHISFTNPINNNKNKASYTRGLSQPVIPVPVEFHTIPQLSEVNRWTERAESVSTSTGTNDLKQRNHLELYNWTKCPERRAPLHWEEVVSLDCKVVTPCKYLAVTFHPSRINTILK